MEINGDQVRWKDISTKDGFVSILQKILYGEAFQGPVHLNPKFRESGLLQQQSNFVFILERRD